MAITVDVFSQAYYQLALDLYLEENYSLVVGKMESSLHAYYAEAEKCRFVCEGMFDHEEFPPFVNAIAGMLDCTCSVQSKNEGKYLLVKCEVVLIRLLVDLLIQ